MNKVQYEIYHEDKHHTSEEFPYNTYLCSIPLDFRTVNLHWHEEVELIVIKKGCGLVSVDLVSYPVKAGDIIFVSSGQLHSIAQKEQEMMEYENILFKPSLLKSSGYDMCYDTFINPFLSGSLHISPLLDNSLPYHGDIISIIRKIDALCDQRNYGYQIALKGYLFQMFYVLLSHCEKNNRKSSSQKSLDKTKRILSYIAEHYQEEITIETIASHCYYSKSYFMKFFKDNIGMSFVQYLKEYRLEIAAKQLSTTSDSISDIALDAGFDNLSYFNRCFKEKYGITPGRYRKIT